MYVSVETSCAREQATPDTLRLNAFWAVRCSVRGTGKPLFLRRDQRERKDCELFLVHVAAPVSNRAPFISRSQGPGVRRKGRRLGTDCPFWRDLSRLRSQSIPPRKRWH